MRDRETYVVTVARAEGNVGWNWSLATAGGEQLADKHCSRDLRAVGVAVEYVINRHEQPWQMQEDS